MVTQLEMGRRVEEEDTFRTVPSTNLVSNSEVNSEEEQEDDEVGRVDDEVDASKTMKQNSVDDMENQGNESLDDRAKINEEEVEKDETNDINGSHKDELEKEPAHEESYAQWKSGGARGGKHIENFASCENINEESHTSHGLVSIVQDSQSPIAEECVESVQKNFQVLNAEPNLGNNQDQEKGVKEANNSGAYESDLVSSPLSFLPLLSFLSPFKDSNKPFMIPCGKRMPNNQPNYQPTPVSHDYDHPVNTPRNLWIIIALRAVCQGWWG
ncbi:hypothetical protein RHGRI_009839 [Rhododendron griersonianum]|uniref:Uncharacterized protein n=1 Tax=Rhododendron griersonianum TaxID=479676 RepID=A0AAV6KG99_9ERIC|nr:hypothetical protein RHGRI_009839 [Rhododendron griersonianum]